MPWLRRLLTSQCRGQVQSQAAQWDLWWIKWHCDRFFSEYFGPLCQYQYTHATHSFPHLAAMLHNSSNVRYRKIAHFTHKNTPIHLFVFQGVSDHQVFQKKNLFIKISVLYDTFTVLIEV